MYGLLIIFALLVAGAFAIEKKGTAVQDTSEKTNQEETQSTENPADPEIISPKPSPYTTANKTGGKLGKNYYLINTSFTEGADYERAIVELSTSSGIPKYTAKLKGSTIELTLSDTSDVDPSTGKKYFNGQGRLLTGGSAIKAIRLSYPEDDSSIIIVLELSTSAGFKISELTNPSRIAIDVKK